MTKRKRINDMPSSKAMWLVEYDMLSSKAQWLVECGCIPPTTFVIVTNQKCQLYPYVRRPYRNPDDRHSTALSGIRLSSIQTGRGRTAAAQFLHFADTQTETSASESVVEVHLPVVRVTVDKKATTTFTTESSRCRPIDSNEDGNGIKKQTCEIDKLI